MNLKYPYLISILISFSVVAIACSAKESNVVEAKTVTAKEVPQEKTASINTTEELGSASIDERYKALFDSAATAIKLTLEENPNNFEAGTHYDVLEPRQRIIGDGEKIEVAEFFSYGCGHCFNAEPYMHAYEGQVAEDVDFKRVPVSFNPFFEHLARGYYTATALGVSEDAHVAIFDAIHIKREDLSKADALADFYAGYGVDKEEFIKTLNSFGISAKIERDKKLARDYQITGVPAVVVNGVYNTGGVKAGNFGAWFQILDQLTDSERKAKLAK